MKTLIIDNYDSFTFNLYQLAGEITGSEPVVIPNDSADWDSLVRANFDCVIISPGPGRPDRDDDFGLSRRAILDLNVPVLGVCLGHQGICHLFGGDVIHAPEPMHGRLSTVYHDSSALFANVPNPFSAVRYHSLACAQPLPSVLVATAWTVDGVVMGLAHRERPIWGVQFHPESIATEHGRTILTNFFNLAGSASTRPITTCRANRAAALRTRSERLHFRRLPAMATAEQLFAQLFSHHDNAFWLDSSLTTESRARFSFMGAPSEVIRSFEGVTETTGEDVLTYLNRNLRARHIPAGDLPFDFNCGYAGYFGYELKALCGAPATQRANHPDCTLLFVDKCVAADHQTNEIYLLCLSESECEAARWFDHITRRLDAACQPAPPALTAGAPRFTVSRSHDTYLEDIARCLAYIRDGESYEICLTNQLRAHFAGDPFDFYRILRRRNPAPYSAFLKFPGMSVACSSPERFLRVRPDGAVESKPIKGTMRRGADPAEDEYMRQRLRLDIKNQAENLMIVDLLRNDLGRVCELGSVEVPALMEVETYATLHQLVSTISGQLRSDRSAVDCFRAAFPGGSMTGAPKYRTMAIIDELEQEARGIYSGCIGYFALNGSADLNIVIRSAVFRGQCVSIGVGGAIVAMSDPEEEWNEILLKGQALVSAFGPGT